MMRVVDAVRYLSPELASARAARSLSWPDLVARVGEQIESDGVTAAGIVVDSDILSEDELEQADRALAQSGGRVFGWYGMSPRQLRDVAPARAVAGLRGFRGVHVAPYKVKVAVDGPDYYPLYAMCQELRVPLAMEVGSAPARSGLPSVALPDLLDTVAFAFPELRLLCVNRGRLWLRTLVRWGRVHRHFHLAVGDDLDRDWDENLQESITHRVDYWHPDGAQKVAWCSAVSSGRPGALIDRLRAQTALNDEQMARVMGANIDALVGRERHLQ